MFMALDAPRRVGVAERVSMRFGFSFTRATVYY